MNSNITIISCNYHSKEFAELLVKSIMVFSNNKHPIVIMDNSGIQELFTCEEYIVVKMEKNMGHGGGLDYLISNYVNTEFTLVFDIDAHILRSGYDLEFLKIMENEKIGLIAPYRGAAKPIHPGVMFFRTEEIKNKIPIKPFNVEIDNYMPIQMDVGQFVPMCLNQMFLKQTIVLKTEAPVYKDVHGQTWMLNGKPTFYHFGYGTRLYGKIEHAGLKKSDIDNMQRILLSQIKF
jgi:hypothetical protein